MSSYQAKRLLNLNEDTTTTTTAARYERAMTMSVVSENKMTVVTETTWKSSNPTNPPSTNLSRANSDISLYMPVRRRSIIQKPGVATRSNSTHDSPVSRPNFRYSHPPTPNLSRQQSFESHRSGVLSMPPRIRDPEVPRVVTPCEDEYQSIGAFKLGSLRIVNGAASPVSPEVDRTKSRQKEGGRNDYFTNRLEAPQPRARVLSPNSTSFLNLEAASPSPGPSSAKPAPAAPVVTEYLADISFSPFSLQDSLTKSPKLQTTSKATALDDDLFEDEPQADYAPAEVLDIRQDPNAKSQLAQINRTVSRTDSGFASGRSPSEASHKPLTKADSGYSSNVSLRSFQSKAQEKELTLSLDKQLSQSSQKTAPQFEDRVPVQSLAFASHPHPPEREAPPPPVPPKDYPPISPTQSKASTATRKSGSSNGRSATTTNSSRQRRAPPLISAFSTSRDSVPKSPDSLPRTPGSARSDRSTSAISVGSASHSNSKPSKLQRFLSSARRPAAPGPPSLAHPTHADDKLAVPVAPREVEHNKPHEGSGLFPLTNRRLYLRPRASLDTLKTIFSVGSVEASSEALAGSSIPPKVPEPVREDDEYASKDASWRHTFQTVPTSIVHVAAHMIPRKPITRKPVPDRSQSTKQKDAEPRQSASPETILVTEAELSGYSSVSNSLGNNAYDAALIAMATSGNGDGAALSPQVVSRTLSFTESTLRTLEMRSPGLANSPLNLPSPALPSPLLARALLSENGKSSPPVSLTTRRPPSLRVPPPLRSQSSTASLSRKASRESIQSYPAAQPPLVKKKSRDSVQSYPSYQQQQQQQYAVTMTDGSSEPSDSSSPPIPPMDPRRINSFRHSQPSNFASPNWDVQTDHGSSRQPSRANSMYGHSRQSSVSSTQNQDGLSIRRPSSAQPWQVRTAKPPLRHRSSYDGFNLQQRRAQYGFAPSMSNGYTAQQKPTYDPWNSNSQFDPGYGHGLQDNRYPPYVPRGHHRNRSISRAAGGNPPYRVLHSYNSPAYRNAPIWG